MHKVESYMHMELPRWLSGKEFICQAGDVGSIPGSGIFLGEENGNPLQCSCLENPRDWESWWAAVYDVTQSRTRLKRLRSSSSSSSSSRPYLETSKNKEGRREHRIGLALGVI